MNAMETRKVKRIIYCYDDGTFKQLDGEELEKFTDNFKRAHEFALIHGFQFQLVHWQEIDLNNDKSKTNEIGDQPADHMQEMRP